MNWRDWIIKRLGGHTAADILLLRQVCDNLAEAVRAHDGPATLRAGETLEGKVVAGPLYVVGDHASVIGCTFFVGGNAAAINVSPTATMGFYGSTSIIGPPAVRS